MKLVRKCPVCHADALLQDAEPVFTEGFYSQVYRCEKGHVWRVRTYFRGRKKTDIEIIEGGDKD